MQAQDGCDLIWYFWVDCFNVGVRINLEVKYTGDAAFLRLCCHKILQLSVPTSSRIIMAVRLCEILARLFLIALKRSL